MNNTTSTNSGVEPLANLSDNLPHARWHDIYHNMGPNPNRSSSCLICQEELGSHDPVLRHKPCGNCFHPDCLTQWIESCFRTRGCATCPMCRDHLTMTRGELRRDLLMHEYGEMRNQISLAVDHAVDDIVPMIRAYLRSALSETLDISYADLSRTDANNDPRWNTIGDDNLRLRLRRRAYYTLDQVSMSIQNALTSLDISVEDPPTAFHYVPYRLDRDVVHGDYSDDYSDDGSGNGSDDDSDDSFDDELAFLGIRHRQGNHRPRDYINLAGSMRTFDRFQGMFPHANHGPDNLDESMRLFDRYQGVFDDSDNGPVDLDASMRLFDDFQQVLESPGHSSVDLDAAMRLFDGFQQVVDSSDHSPVDLDIAMRLFDRFQRGSFQRATNVDNYHDDHGYDGDVEYR